MTHPVFSALRLPFGPLALATLLNLAGAAQAGPISPYYITNGALKLIRVVQGNQIVSTWNIAQNTYPIAVLDTVKTYATDATNTGAEYTLAGVPTGTSYPFQGNGGEALDGATDGKLHNYLVSAADDSVYQFDLDWKDPVKLFTLPTNPTGITFDQKAGTLWVARDGRIIEQYTTDGVLLSSFTYSGNNTTRIGSLAWEPATDTLWGVINGTSTLRQFSTSGILLQTATIPGLSSNGTGNNWGGEFALEYFPPALAAPEPTSFVLFGMCVAACAGGSFWRRRKPV